MELYSIASLFLLPRTNYNYNYFLNLFRRFIFKK